MNKRKRDAAPLVLIQTRIPADVFAWIAEEATREGLSIAALLRRRLILDKRRSDDASGEPFTVGG